MHLLQQVLTVIIGYFVVFISPFSVLSHRPLTAKKHFSTQIKDAVVKSMHRGSSSRLVFGIGKNDAGYTIMQKKYDENTKTWRVTWACPYYTRWVAMLKVCYSPAVHERIASYRGCTICEDWKTFSNFRRWMLQQNWQGRHLDKDILLPGNKVYSPDTCFFVPVEINNLLSASAATIPTFNASSLPTGVFKPAKASSYCAKISKFGQTIYLGSFDTPERAYEAFRKAKGRYLLQLANSLSEISDLPIRNALKMRAAEFVDVRWFRAKTASPQ